MSPEKSLWLAGAIGRLADDGEIEAYLALTDDAAAESFIDAFWRRRDPDPRFEANPLREDFHQRSEEADKEFSEAGYPGRRTDRGVIYVLYGPPDEQRYDPPGRRGGPPIEIWIYERGSEPGLDGKRPNRLYRFSRQGDLTAFHRGSSSDRRRLPDGVRPPARRRP